MVDKFRQSHGKIQELLDKLEKGGGSVDAYTKAESDAKFATKAVVQEIQEQIGDINEVLEEVL